jgi:SnoaL-like domain
VASTTDAGGLTAAEIGRLRQHLDEADIRACIDGYFHALDSRNLELLSQVFAPDAWVSFGVVSGEARVVEGLDRITELMRGVDAFRTSHHGIRNMSIRLDGDRAHTNTFAVDALLVSGMESVVRFHGLRYVDDLERRPEGWRIVRRHKYELWRHHAAGVLTVPELPDQ